MGKRSVLCGVCVAAIMALIPASVASAGSVKLSVQAAGSGGDGTISHAAAKAKRQGYLVPNDAAYARQKAAAAAAAPANRHVFDVHAPLAPTAARSFNGIRQPTPRRRTRPAPLARPATSSSSIRTSRSTARRATHR